MEMRSIVGRPPAEAKPSARREISLNRVEVGHSKLKTAGASIVEKVERKKEENTLPAVKRLEKRVSLLGSEKMRAMKGQSQSMIMRDLERRKPSNNPHKATISCLQYHDF